MIYAIFVVAGLVVGGTLAWLISANRVSRKLALRLEEVERRANVAEGRASGLDGMVVELRAQNQRAAEDFEKLRSKLETEQGAKGQGRNPTH